MNSRHPFHPTKLLLLAMFMPVAILAEPAVTEPVHSETSDSESFFKRDTLTGDALAVHNLLKTGKAVKSLMRWPGHSGDEIDSNHPEQ